MPAKWTPPNLNDLIGSYLAGESQNSLSKRYGVDRATIKKHLTENGVAVRDQTDSNRLMMQVRTPEEHARNTQAAHAAVRGRTVPLSTKLRSAETREARQIGISATEQLLQFMLRTRGIEATPQKAIGPYNADLGADPVAVEVFGGNWHAYGGHRERAVERCRYILEEGWNLVVIWVSKRNGPLSEAAADYIATFIEESRCNPAFRGEYRVIWGSGKEASRNRSDFDHITRVPPRGRANGSRS